MDFRLTSVLQSLPTQQAKLKYFDEDVVWLYNIWSKQKQYLKIWNRKLFYHLVEIQSTAVEL